MTGEVDLSSLLGDLEAAFAQAATTALGLDGVVTVERVDVPPLHSEGAYLALVAPRGALQIGVASDGNGCQALAKGLMGLTVADPRLEPGQLADAVCEVVSIVAGGFKSRVRERMGSLSMGLPVFFHGPAQPTEHTAVRVALVRAGPFTVALLLVHPRHPAQG